MCERGGMKTGKSEVSQNSETGIAEGSKLKTKRMVDVAETLTTRKK
jgi:hypothetical protein